MTLAIDVTDMVVRVRNNTTGSLFYSYIGPHGTTLPAKTSYDMPGSLMTVALAGGRFNLRKWNALMTDLNAGTIEIIHTPVVVLYDNAYGSVVRLNVNNGILGVVNPSWGAYSGGS